MEHLAPWQQRTIALAILGLLLALVTTLAVAPLVSGWRAHQVWRRDAVNALATAQGLSRQRSEYEALRSALSAAAPERRLWAEAPEIAQTALSSDIRAMIDAGHGTVQSLQPLAARREGQLQRISLQVSLALTIDQLAELTEHLSRAPHFLTLDHVSITAPDVQDSTVNPLLSVRIDVSGYTSFAGTTS